MNKQGNTFFSNKVQEIHTNLDGKITQSSDTIFDLRLGENIFTIHPFFESLQRTLLECNETSLAFPCVQLEMEKQELICDITIKKELGFLAILLFDYSNHYQNLHEAAQVKKTAMLNEQAHELNTKYSEEKRAYLEFIRERIDSKIVGELEIIISDLNDLKHTTLNNNQLTIFHKIEAKIAILHSKALQIKKGVEIDLD
ncbi:hypothetical protein [Ulvibacter antarcticus]|uniref:Uncharacterized protein n=1 Tax=Ulvibacter antarcticus TaxID=442714 RepID=A0A3L9Z7D5_9FLAO|nr:hypothetical protein [Ulvibacter antarcticus]RMA66185.1 hypothetical protein BXY75_0604 [Ulvibacter antarcticus]